MLFHYPVLNAGGAEMSSLRMIKGLADRGWDVTLVLTTGGGNLESFVDPRVNVVRLRPRAYGRRFAAARGVAEKVCALPDLFAYGVSRAIGGFRMVPFAFRKFDAAALLAISASPFFLTRVVKTNCRVHWIRSDFNGNFPARDRAIAKIRGSAARVDAYVCVSNYARDSFVETFSGLEQKAFVIYNLLDADAMRKKARMGGDPFPDCNEPRVRILTVCRLKEHSKALLRLVRVASRLASEGHRFIWLVVGDGPDRELMEAAIKKAGVEEYIHLCGHLENPFPAYAHSDVVAVVSKYEGLCGVVNEAKICGKAVVATEVSGVREQLTDGENGLIVANTETGIVDGLRRLIKDNRLRKKLANDNYPEMLLDDAKKIDQIEALLLSKGKKV